MQNQEISVYFFKLVEDWEIFENLLTKIASEKFGEKLDNHPIFLVEPPIHSRPMRLKIVESVFEKLQAKSFFLHKAPVLASFFLNNKDMYLVKTIYSLLILAPILLIVYQFRMEPSIPKELLKQR